MSYSYGDKRTAYNGILLWLQGVRHYGDFETDYVRGMDWNQIHKYVRRLMIDFLATKGVSILTTPYREDKYAQLTQKHFKDFTKWYLENQRNLRK